MNPRDERRHDEQARKDKRTDAQHDRDRLLYCSALRRLGNVTQVVSADHGYIFHNRLTHTLKVAQIARRLAEYFRKDKKYKRKLIEELGGLDPDVVEAAGLAHDLGHPPFGHLAETVLDDLAKNAGGYEGNAQSFRIVTKLAVRIEDQDKPGLNLTRATVNAILKYPWHRTARGKKSRKWGAYKSENDDFKWARKIFDTGDERKTLEAEIMDYADDIAYSIYDLEDFYKAGKIPLERFVSSKGKDSSEIKDFIKASFDRWEREGKPKAGTETECRAALDTVSQYFPRWPYSGRHAQRGFLRDMTKVLVSRYIDGISLSTKPTKSERRVEIDETLRREMKMLQEFTWHYVIDNPALASQQHGYKLVIQGLFKFLLDAIDEDRWTLFPPGVSELIKTADRSDANVRIVADFIASMSEPQAVELFQRLSGISMGSFLKNIL